MFYIHWLDIFILRDVNAMRFEYQPIMDLHCSLRNQNHQFALNIAARV
jgi:hypothetical protein